MTIDEITERFWAVTQGIILEGMTIGVIREGISWFLQAEDIEGEPTGPLWRINPRMTDPQVADIASNALLIWAACGSQLDSGPQVRHQAENSRETV